MIHFPHTVLDNDPKLAGALACKPAKKMIINDYRYAVAPVHTRFGTVEWFVWDAEHPNSDTKRAEVIRQEDTFEKAIEGLVR